VLSAFCWCVSASAEEAVPDATGRKVVSGQTVQGANRGPSTSVMPTHSRTGLSPGTVVRESLPVVPGNYYLDTLGETWQYTA